MPREEAKEGIELISTWGPTGIREHNLRDFQVYIYINIYIYYNKSDWTRDKLAWYASTTAAIGCGGIDIPLIPQSKPH